MLKDPSWASIARRPKSGKEITNKRTAVAALELQKEKEPVQTLNTSLWFLQKWIYGFG
jgi:hypothetical protein